MKLHLRDHLRGLHPGEAYRRWRDELEKRAARLPVVRELSEHGRAQQGERLHRRLRFALDVELPRIARPFLPHDALRLELAEAWDERRLACEWSLCSLGIAPEAATARGRLAFDGDALVVHGEVIVAPSALPPLARAAAPLIEQTLARAIERGYRELARTLHL